MSDPIKDFIKHSFGVKQSAVPWGTIGTVAATAVAAPLAGAAIGALGDATKGIYGALTKKRDFNNMLEFNEELQHAHKRDPKLVNAAFSTLRTLNPTYSKDPLVAGSFVRNLMEMPEGAFVAANTATSARILPSMAEQGYLGGISPGLQRGYEAALEEDAPTKRKHDLQSAKELGTHKALQGVVGNPANWGRPGFTKQKINGRWERVPTPPSFTPHAQTAVGALQHVR